MKDPEPPSFIIKDWMPCGYATLLAGHGGVGKSGIALQLAVCIAAGVPFFGQEVAKRRVLYLSCEDREAVLHWRLTRICAHLGLDMAALAPGLMILDLVGRDTVLWERLPGSDRAITPAIGALTERVAAHGTELLVIDGISDTYGGSGASKTEVKRYVNNLVALIPADRGAVLLVGHIDKNAAKNGAGSEGYDGTTGWHNSVRARWYLYPEKEEGDQRTGELVLKLQKSNLGPTDYEMRFSWSEDERLFIGRRYEAPSSLERSIRDRTEREGILAALRACYTVPGMYVPAAASGKRTAYHVLSARPEFPDTLSRKGAEKAFRRHIEVLRHSGEIVEEERYSKSQKRGVAVLVPRESANVR